MACLQPFTAVLLCSKNEESLLDGKAAGTVPDLTMAEGDTVFTNVEGEAAASNPVFSADVNADFTDTQGEPAATRPCLAMGDCDLDFGDSLGEATQNLEIGDGVQHNSTKSLISEDCNSPGDLYEKQGLVPPCDWLLLVFWPGSVVTMFCLVWLMLSCGGSGQCRLLCLLTVV